MDVKTELKDEKFIYRATVGEKEKRLVFDYDKCCGCSICVDACPTSAIELGPIFEIATGMDAPPIMIDEHKCSFCGMCAAFCPYNAIKMEDISEDYPHLQSSIEVNDSKCLPCKLCERVCDSDAIKVTFDMPKKKIWSFIEKWLGEK
jgi:Formate hydrogenlyase subunit 6/NADH:ubiquinone oxidoreductase 23 kD subunit (chain I)